MDNMDGMDCMDRGAYCSRRKASSTRHPSATNARIRSIRSKMLDLPAPFGPISNAIDPRCSSKFTRQRKLSA